MATQQDAFQQVNESIRKSLECPVCLEPCFPPIYMCTRGHNLCNGCRASVSLKSCPTCREPGKPAIRNLFAEQTSVVVKLPCTNAEEGCDQVYNFREMNQHLETCNKTHGYLCYLIDRSLGECHWVGKRKDLVAHVLDKHGAGYYSEEECVTLNCSVLWTGHSLTDTKLLLAAHGELFWIALYWDPDQNIRLIWAEYVGLEDNASKYKCEFRYCSNDGRLETSCCIQTLGRDGDFLLPTHSFLLSDNLINTFIKNGFFSITARILKK